MSDFEIVECDQGDNDWHQARSGATTASMFSEVRKVTDGLNEQMQKYVNAIRIDGLDKKDAMEKAGYKAAPKSKRIERALDGERVGDYTSAAKDYAFRLAVERITGKPLDGGFTTWAMQRGNDLEPEARDLHERRIGMIFEHAGFVRTTDGKFGASADGLIEPDGGAEYKCLVDPARMRQVIVEQDLSEFMDQMQGGMWITGRKWWHYGLYCPDLKAAGKELILHRVQRDDDYIEALESDLVAFDRYVEHCKQKILSADLYCGMGDHVEAPEPVATKPATKRPNVFATGATA
jgi:hypothetical protein